MGHFSLMTSPSRPLLRKHTKLATQAAPSSTAVTSMWLIFAITQPQSKSIKRRTLRAPCAASRSGLQSSRPLRGGPGCRSLRIACSLRSIDRPRSSRSSTVISSRPWEQRKPRSCDRGGYPRGSGARELRADVLAELDFAGRGGRKGHACANP